MPQRAQHRFDDATGWTVKRVANFADAPMCAVRRVLVRQLDGAAAALERRDRSDRAVHRIRKQLKRTRATLRLLRECIGATRFHRENALLRDAARPLTPVRDAKVLLETLRRLDPGTGAGRKGAPLRLVYRALREEQRAARGRLRPMDLARAARVLREIERRMAGVQDLRLRRAALGPALERAYRRGRRAFARALQNGTDERLHEWRKQTQYLLNQLAVVSALDPEFPARDLKRCRQLAKSLGDDHDLALLNDKMSELTAQASGESRLAARKLLSRLARRRKSLQHKAHRLGRRLYLDV